MPTLSDRSSGLASSPLALAGHNTPLASALAPTPAPILTHRAQHGRAHSPRVVVSSPSPSPSPSSASSLVAPRSAPGRDSSPGPFKHDEPSHSPSRLDGYSARGFPQNGGGLSARGVRAQKGLTAAPSGRPLASAVVPLQHNALTPRARHSPSTAPPPGYSYTSNRSPRAQPSPQNSRYNFHASERAAAESLNVGDAHTLSQAALAAFSAASLPLSASSSLAHFASHPVTFDSRHNRDPRTPTPNSPSAARGAYTHTQPLPPPTFDTHTGAQLPPLLAHRPPGSYRPATTDGVGLLPPPPAVAKLDRASQTDPLPATAPPSIASNGGVTSPHPTAPPAAAAFASTTPATVPAPSRNGLPVVGRREGYEAVHRHLLELHHPSALAEMDVLDLVKEESRSQSQSRSHSRKHSPAGTLLQGVDLLPSPSESLPLDFFAADLAAFYSTLGNWDECDIFRLYDLTNGWPLSFLFMMVDKKHQFLAANAIDPVAAFHFILEVESNYLPLNPYHTATHAADVLHAAFHLVEHTPMLKAGLSSADCLALYIGCAVHDYSHPGVNNSFLVNSRAPLALRYNDRSVLESFHISSVCRMMHHKPECNILAGLAFADFARIRKTLIDLVLATDLAVHFELMGVFKRKIAPTPSGAAHQLNLATSEEDRLMVMQMVLKCGDLSHPARSRRLHLRWSELVTEEFFLQGDREKVLSLPPSMFMDRATTNLAQSQIGFIRFLVAPMFQAYTSLSQRDYWSRKVEENLDWWQEVAAVEAEEKKAAAEQLERGIDPDTENSADADSETSARQGGASEPNSGTVSASTSAANSHPVSRRASSDSSHLKLLPASLLPPSTTSTPSGGAKPPSPRASSSASNPAGGEGNKASFSPSSSSAAASASSSETPSSRGSGNNALVMPLVTTPTSAPISPSNAHSAGAGTAPPLSKRASRRQMRAHRRTSAAMTSELELESLATETAQVAALSAAGASVTEAQEHHEEEQAAAAAASSHPAGGGGTLGSARGMHTLGLVLDTSSASSKRKSVLKGVAPPASPLVLHRAASRASDDGILVSSPSPATRPLGLALSERRALSLSVGRVAAAGGSSTSSPLQTGSHRASHPPLTQVASGETTNSSSHSSGPSSACGSEGSVFERALLRAQEHADSEARRLAESKPLAIWQQFEASHGAIYHEVRELAALTAVELEAASLTSPLPLVAPSFAGPQTIPAFSRKAHELLHVKPRTRTSAVTSSPTTAK